LLNITDNSKKSFCETCNKYITNKRQHYNTENHKNKISKEEWEKQIKELKASIDHKKEVIANSKEKLDQKTAHLKHKKAELSDIMAETQKEEGFLMEKSAEFEAQIEERLLAAYKRIRSSVRNGLAVVSIERGASSGSFFTIPPQTQVEIAARKKIITDEHSGRILVDASLAEEEREKMQKLFAHL
jgi:predicted  nucleic acid-binding Zn-ribbon protein